jgi:uncharacterized protein YeaO (DUF488 family)
MASVALRRRQPRGKPKAQLHVVELWMPLLEHAQPLRDRLHTSGEQDGGTARMMGC